MTLQTSAQQKAQAELDAVIGTDRLPTLGDRVRLPYLEALYWEVIRAYFGGIGVYFSSISHPEPTLYLIFHASQLLYL